MIRNFSIIRQDGRHDILTLVTHPPFPWIPIFMGMTAFLTLLGHHTMAKPLSFPRRRESIRCVVGRPHPTTYIRQVDAV